MFIQNRTGKLKYAILLIIALASILGIILVKQTRISPLSWGWFGPISTSHGVAMEGYDSVAYHTEQKAMTGRREHRLTWNEVEWRFATKYNQELFAADPERYAPQFGGNCANAVSIGMTKKADPQVWFMDNDMLYVFSGEDAKSNFLTKISNGVLKRSHESWAKRTIQ